MIIHHPDTGIFHLQNQHFSYVLQAEQGVLLHRYWGPALADGPLEGLFAAPGGIVPFDTPFSRLPLEVPTNDTGYMGQRALDVVNGSGDDVLMLRYEGHRILPGKPGLAGLPSSYAEKEEEAQTLQITLRDGVTSLEVLLSYTVFSGYGVLARSTLLTNRGGADMEIRQAAQAARLPREASDLLYLKGAWLRERQAIRHPLPRAGFTLDSRRGASGHEHSPFLAALTPDAGEEAGLVYAMTQVYSGSFRMSTDVGVNDEPVMLCGMNPDVFSWRLEPGASFQAPEALFVCSSRGLGGLSALTHPFIRERICRGAWRDRERPILINNWEATYFDFNEDKLLDIARAGAEIGCELFVMDDGWFGRRDLDNCSLGDWVIHPEKLPGGLKQLVDRVHDLGMMFGIWFEPEMVSPDSDLYRAHPDWCLHVAERPRTTARNQLILDLARTEVQDYVIRAVGDVLRSAPIDYVKWDMNRNMSEAFSAALPPRQRLESQHRYMLGLYRVMEELTRSFPQVLFEGCSGGGGRFDTGILCYMPQYWTSDDTDAYERLRIQYATSLLYPISAMCAHVSAVPNHQTGRTISFETRCLVAMGGNFGFELDLSRTEPKDLATARQAIREYKRLRSLIREGHFTRLADPFRDSSLCAWQFAAKDGSRCLVLVYRGLVQPNGRPYRVFPRLPEEDVLYREKAGGIRATGGALNRVGIPLPDTAEDFASYLFEFIREEAPGTQQLT